MLVALLLPLLWWPSEGVTVVFPPDLKPTLDNVQTGFIPLFNDWKNGTAAPDKAHTLPWSDEWVEYVSVKVQNMQGNLAEGEYSFDFIDAILENVKGRGRQAIVHLRMEEWWESMDRTFPKSWLDPSITSCQGGDGIVWRRVANYNSEALLARVDKMIKEFGERFDGDSRLFAFQLGIVGSEGRWKHPPQCDETLPNATSMARLLNTAVTNFKKTFVQVPINDPSRFALFNLSAHRMLGIHTYNLGSVTFQDNLKTLGLLEKYRTSPITATVYPALRSCWFGENVTAACLQTGAGSNIPDFEEVVATRHPVTVHYPSLYSLYETNAVSLNLIYNASFLIGPRYVLHQVCVESFPSKKVEVAAQIENIGSSAFYAPSDKALRLLLKLHNDIYEVTHPTIPLTQLVRADGPTVYRAVVSFPDVDECVANGAVCQAAGQSCVDDNHSPYSKGNWYCVCKTGTPGFRERARKAVCKKQTFAHNELTYFNGSVSSAIAIGKANTLGLFGTSFTISMHARPRSCTDGGCTNDTLQQGFVWEDNPMLGTLSKDGFKGLQVSFYGWQFRFNVMWTDCKMKDPPKPALNRWHHFAVRFNLAALTYDYFLDGKPYWETCTVKEPFKGDTEEVYLGRSYSIDRAFFGELDLVRIHSEMLTDEEIAILAQKPEPLKDPVPVELRLQSSFGYRSTRFANNHPNISLATGVVTVSIPPPTSTGGCVDPVPTPAPTPPVATPTPPAQTTGCAQLQLVGFNLTVPSTSQGPVPAKCDGVYLSADGVGHWVKDDATRELWALADNTYLCVDPGRTTSDPHYGTFPASWWGEHLTCLFYATPAPSTNTTNDTTTPVPSSLPPTTAPPTATLVVTPQPTPIPTDTPQTAVPSTPVPRTWSPPITLSPDFKTTTPSPLPPTSPPPTTTPSPTTPTPSSNSTSQPTPVPSSTSANTSAPTPSSTSANTSAPQPSPTPSSTPSSPTPANTSSPTPSSTTANTPTPSSTSANTSAPTPSSTSANTSAPQPSSTPSSPTPANTSSPTPSSTSANTPTPSSTSANTSAPSSIPSSTPTPSTSTSSPAAHSPAPSHHTTHPGSAGQPSPTLTLTQGPWGLRKAAETDQSESTDAAPWYLWFLVALSIVLFLACIGVWWKVWVQRSAERVSRPKVTFEELQEAEKRGAFEESDEGVELGQVESVQLIQV